MNQIKKDVKVTMFQYGLYAPNLTKRVLFNHSENHLYGLFCCRKVL